MRFITHFSAQQTVQLCQLYQEQWWSQGRSLAETQRGLKGSQIVIGAVDESDHLVAFVRVLTDFTFKAMLFDLIVADAYQNTGLGKELLQRVKQHPQLQEVKHLELYCLPDLLPYYKRQGFSSAVAGVQLLRYTPEA